jgi:transcriptional regulator with XRE-family HTH domain
MDWDAIVGRNVRRLRLAKGLTQEQLAGEAELAMRHVGRIERGESSATARMLGRLAAALGTDPGAFFDPTP